MPTEKTTTTEKTVITTKVPGGPDVVTITERTLTVERVSQ